MKLGRSSNKSGSSTITKIALYAFLGFVAFSIADLTIIYFRDIFMPNTAPPKKIVPFKPPAFVDRSQYNTIVNRNLFSSTGIIPDPFNTRTDEGPKQNVPTPSQLPIEVIGTLVHSNPEKSIAALNLKGKNKSGSYSVGHDVEGMATIEAIERNRVYLRNAGNGLLEFIDMNKGENKVAFGSEAKAATIGGKEVAKLDGNTFEIKKSDLLKYTNDLSSVLMQARAVPNRDPNTGEINGFRILDMQPGSIFEQLGLQRMDVLKGVNGSPVTSVQSAMEQYNALKNGNDIKIQIERGGKTETFNYKVK